MQYIRDIEKMVLSMIQPDPLPGSYRHDTAGIQEIVDHALRETEMVAENHFDGIIVPRTCENIYSGSKKIT